jgi:hypothetical protein
MSKYIISFEFFGKKFRTQMAANNEEDAKYKLHGEIYKKICITNIEEVKHPLFDNDVFNFLKGFT